MPLRNATGESAGTVELSDTVFGQPLNIPLVYQALVMYRLNLRQGTHSTKVRSQVSGGGRKPWPQKHTGRARAGSTRAPQFRHGGVVFGPHPRDHRRYMPRRMRHQALRCVLSEKARSGNLVLVDHLELSAPRTKAIVQVLADLGVQGNTLIVTIDPQENIIRSARNIDRVWTLPVRLLNAFELLRRDNVVMTLEAARRAEEMWESETPRHKHLRESLEAIEEPEEDAEADEGPDPQLEEDVPEAIVEELEVEAAAPEETEDEAPEDQPEDELADSAEASEDSQPEGVTAEDEPLEDGPADAIPTDAAEPEDDTVEGRGA